MKNESEIYKIKELLEKKNTHKQYTSIWEGIKRFFSR